MPVTQPAEIKSGDVLNATYELKLGPWAFWAKVTRGRAEFGFNGETEPFGYITFGSPTSGAIWIGEECIAEYDGLQNRRADIVPISAGRKHPEGMMSAEPVAFMLNEAVRRLK